MQSSIAGCTICRVAIRSPNQPSPTAGLLAHAQRLLAARTSTEVLVLTCREVQRVAGADRLFGSFGTSAGWSAGERQRFDGAEQAALSPAQHSALFAVHRALARDGAPVVLEHDAHVTISDALCAAKFVHAVPIMQPQHRRLCGLLALCIEAPLDERAIDAIQQVASLAAVALENVQRISSAQRDRERLSLLAEAAEEAHWDWSPDTGEFWWGGGVQTLIGDVVAQSRLSWKFQQVHPDDADRVRRSFDRALAAVDAESWSAEYQLRRTDGSWIRVEERAHILRDSAGVPHRVVGAMRDVTELRALLAREHTARTEAERANRAKDEFLAMLGHELRNPLSPIMAALRLLRSHGGPEMNEKGLMIIERQARHLTRLVDDLLDIARIANGKVQLDRERLDLADVVHAALETANPLIEERRHTVESRVDRHLAVDADRARLQQVVGNLLNNAAKYTPPGGRITVDAHVVEGFVELRIADSGIGISADLLPSVFDTFVQSQQALDRSRGGLGLGLAIVRNLVELHGGTVAVRSGGQGQGSAFFVRLPAATSSSEEIVVASPAELVQDTLRRVLVVDDNQDSAESLAMLLNYEGHQTRVVHSGPDALAAVDDFEPDVVLLDLGLPVMDGYEVARQLRQRTAAKRICLVAVTGYGQAGDRLRTRAAGFDEHLVKPIQFEHLHQAIRDCHP